MKKIVYIRYILPAVLVVLTLAVALIPNVSFTLEGELKQARSLVTLMADAWTQCRAYINNEQAVVALPAIQSFSLWTMLGIVISAVLAIASAGLSVWSSAMAVCILRDPHSDKGAERRGALCRVFPGRVWMLAAGWLVVIPMMFPYYLAAMYQNLLHLNVTVQSGLTPVAVLLAVLSGAVALLSRRLETDLDMNPFE